MAAVTQPGYFHTAGSAHLEGIDLAGKTGTAQVMSHQALDKTNKGHHTLPNVWFVGVVPRRNPELVVAVLWEHGEFSYYPARLGARVVAAYVEKQRRLAHNLMPVKAPTTPPVEVGAVWTTPNAVPDAKGETMTKLHAGKFFVGPNGVVQPGSQNGQQAKAKMGQSAMGQAAPQSSGNETAKATKPMQAAPQSAKLNSPALPGKAAPVKSQ
jgi:membrane peptidoglycan carboxypeptidase